MNDTIEYYNRNAESFIAGTVSADMAGIRERFLHYVPVGGRILDAGCGSGRDALAFLHAGYTVDAFDASEEICRLASENVGFPVRCQRFEDLTGTDCYDGIWACASLLHVRKKDLPNVMQRLCKILRPGGVFYASFKKGTGERVKDGRFFCDMTQEGCRKLLEDSGFIVLELFDSGDVREGREGELWVNVIGRKINAPCSAVG